MEITLEKIELVKDRTGVSYKEAKEALEFANGNVVDAIIYVEENIDHEFSSREKKAVNKVMDNVKEVVRKGNVTKLRVYHGDEVVLNLPVLFGVAGTVLFPWGAVASAVAAAFTRCRVELVKEDGSVVDALVYLEQKKSQKTTDLLEKVKAMVREGNVNKIRVKRDEKVLLSVPVNVGIVGGLVGLAAAPWWGVLAAAAAAYGLDVKFEILKDDGSITTL